MTDEEMMAKHEERKEMTQAEKPAPIPRAKLGRPAGLPIDAMFSGRERDRNCRWCGEQFVQRELSPAMAKWVAALPPGAQQQWKETITENALPLFCVRCERRELGHVPVQSTRMNAA